MFRRRHLVAALVAAVAVAAVLLVAGGTRTASSAGPRAAGRVPTESGRHAGSSDDHATSRPSAISAELRRVRPANHAELLFLVTLGAALTALACWSIAHFRRVATPVLLVGSYRSRAPPAPA